MRTANGDNLMVMITSMAVGVWLYHFWLFLEVLNVRYYNWGISLLLSTLYTITILLWFKYTLGETAQKLRNGIKVRR